MKSLPIFTTLPPVAPAAEETLSSEFTVCDIAASACLLSAVIVIRKFSCAIAYSACESFFMFSMNCSCVNFSPLSGISSVDKGKNSVISFLPFVSVLVQ
ncbi:MAG: hypothetical protein ACK54Y_09070 [Bacteroidota bacterium]